MDNFTNETIDIEQLPKFEEVQFTPLNANYWKVILINNSILFLILGIALGIAFNFIPELYAFQFIIIVIYVLVLGLSFILLRISFYKRGFAFREHDALLRSGVIVTRTIIIPYNRVQHMAIHQGIIARYFGLAEIEIFTAGGSATDIKIPGIQKEQAENIRQLLMVKIQKQL